MRENMLTLINYVIASDSAAISSLLHGRFAYYEIATSLRFSNDI
jgi:hypothetical protein